MNVLCLVGSLALYKVYTKLLPNRQSILVKDVHCSNPISQVKKTAYGQTMDYIKILNSKLLKNKKEITQGHVAKPTNDRI